MKVGTIKVTMQTCSVQLLQKVLSHALQLLLLLHAMDVLKAKSFHSGKFTNISSLRER